MPLQGSTRLAAASDKVYQLLAHGRWFSPSTPTSCTTKTGRHDIAEILLKVALNTINQIKSLNAVAKYRQLCGFFSSVSGINIEISKCGNTFGS